MTASAPGTARPATMTRTEQMLSRPALPLILAMAAPNAIAFLVQGTVSMTEVWFIGHLGTAALAAIALMFPGLMLMQMLANGAIGGALSSSVARALGRGRKDQAEALIWHGIVIAVAAGGLFWLLWWLGGAALLHKLDVTPAVIDDALLYGHILFGGSVALWLMGIIAAVYRGMGEMRFPAVVMVLGAFIQIPLSGALILGWAGLPQLGVAGAAVSVVVTMGLMAAVLLGRLTGSSQVLRLHLSRFALQRALFADIFRVGALASLSPVLTVLAIAAVNVIVSGFGASALAGYGIAARLEFLLIPMVFGIGAAMTAIVGTNVGAGRVARAEQVGWTGGALAAGLTGSIGLLLAVAPGLWVGLFTDDPETFSAGARFLQIVGPVFLFQGLGLALYFGSQGAGFIQWPVFAALVRFVVAIGGASLAAYGFGLGLDAVYACIAAGMLLFGAITASALRLGAWRRAAPAH
ncbi:MATE family efflux transporter [Marinobacter segnicrescens]|uniref:Multidrug-efflux transporter n=1 Tax=Marinobacter segnicrescens TaxID=430453 RepID=A0A1I0HGZ1_9GAMM|nr:MATE family efflux transporter [Marinobacter segnicrescens]SET83183.1 putative efflux protein, MATE family [Marinobacter segnicrescens]